MTTISNNILQTGFNEPACGLDIIIRKLRLFSYTVILALVIMTNYTIELVENFSRKTPKKHIT